LTGDCGAHELGAAREHFKAGDASAALGKAAGGSSQWSGMCEKARQSRILLTSGTALDDIPRGSHPGSSELPASKTARNIMQRGLPCGQDPALPVLFALISH